MGGGPKHNRKQQNNPKIRRVQRKAIKNNRATAKGVLSIPSHRDGVSALSNPKKLKLMRVAKNLASGKTMDESMMDVEEATPATKAKAPSQASSNKME